MSTEKRNFPVLAVLGGLIVLAVFIRLATAVDLTESPIELASSGQHGPAHSEAGAEKGEDLHITVEALPCFQECHTVEAFNEGGDFPHSLHLEQEEIGHCHMCHAFDSFDVADGHSEAIVREEICENCH